MQWRTQLLLLAKFYLHILILFIQRWARAMFPTAQGEVTISGRRAGHVPDTGDTAAGHSHRSVETADAVQSVSDDVARDATRARPPRLEVTTPPSSLFSFPTMDVSHITLLLCFGYVKKHWMIDKCNEMQSILRAIHLTI